MLLLVMLLILALVAKLTLQGGKIMADLTRLTEEVSENTAVIASAVTLLGQLAALIRENATNPAELNALADQLDLNSAGLAAAIAANTPGAEVPPTEG